VSFTRVVATPENGLAVAALEELANALRSATPRRVVNPIYICGPPGAGKSLLLSALEAELNSSRQRRRVNQVRADLFDQIGQTPESTSFKELVETDLLLFDDVHLLRVRHDERLAVASEWLVRLLDERAAEDRPTVVTGDVGPCNLDQLPSRLTGRLASGLTLALPSMAMPSRLLLLEKYAQRRQLAVPPNVMVWLAENLSGSGRELEGAIVRLQELARHSPRPIDLAMVSRQFKLQVESRAMTIEHIAERVGEFFRVDTKRLQSRRRFSGIQMPRQVGMYLVRRLTSLSLEEIGAYFGGRDHSTVLHACRKIERTLRVDSELTSAVQHLHSCLESSLCNSRH
jgi:chromosomal replication initiator protein